MAIPHKQLRNPITFHVHFHLEFRSRFIDAKLSLLLP